MTKTTYVTETVNSKRYTATIVGDRVGITVDRVWVGDGTWNGETIVDCPADLGEAVYEKLDSALRAELVGSGSA